MHLQLKQGKTFVNPINEVIIEAKTSDAPVLIIRDQFNTGVEDGLQSTYKALIYWSFDTYQRRKGSFYESEITVNPQKLEEYKLIDINVTEIGTIQVDIVELMTRRLYEYLLDNGYEDWELCDNFTNTY